MAKISAAAGAALLALGYGGMNCFYNVEGGHRSILFSRLNGLQDKVYKEGLNFKMPWLHKPIIYDIRATPRRISSPTGSKDLQTVNISLRVLSRPDPNNLVTISRRLGGDFNERVLPSIVNEILKSVVAQFNASQLITQRQLEAQRAAILVEKAVQERQQKIVQAEGEARAATLLGAAIATNPGYLKLRRIGAAKNISNTVSRSNNKMYLNADSLFLNIRDTEGDTTLFNLSKEAGEMIKASNPELLEEVAAEVAEVVAE
eukprot:sb/3468477/